MNTIITLVHEHVTGDLPRNPSGVFQVKKEHGKLKGIRIKNLTYEEVRPTLHIRTSAGQMVPFWIESDKASSELSLGFTEAVKPDELTIDFDGPYAYTKHVVVQIGTPVVSRVWSRLHLEVE